MRRGGGASPSRGYWVLGDGRAPGFRGTGLPASEDSRSPGLLALGAPRFQKLRIPEAPRFGGLPVPVGSCFLGLRITESGLPDLRSPGHLPSEYTFPGLSLPGALPLPSTPSLRDSCCLRDPRRTAAPFLLSLCSRQYAEPPPLPLPVPPRAAAGAARPVAEPWPGGVLGGLRCQLTPCLLLGPVFTHAWVPEMRAIEVWVPEGPALMVRLCHQLALECEELPRPFHQQVLVEGGGHISLPYEFLVPCLCIEVGCLPLQFPRPHSTLSHR
uniref:Uncharacterized protein n=1 Tax=Malurus cyaneus samueli TaxID=2593467 RepID=A0A8C5T8M3_9PASS